MVPRSIGDQHKAAGQLHQEYLNAEIGATIRSVASGPGRSSLGGDALGLVCSGAPQRLDWAVGWLSLAFLPRCVGPLHLDVVAATSHGTPAADLVARSVVEGPAAGLASTHLESRPGSVLGALPDRVGQPAECLTQGSAQCADQAITVLAEHEPNRQLGESVIQSIEGFDVTELPVVPEQDGAQPFADGYRYGDVGGP